MTFHTFFPPQPSHTNHSKYFNCLSWKCRIASPHTSWSWDTQQIPGPSAAPPQPCPITSLPCCGPSGRAQLFLPPTISEDRFFTQQLCLFTGLEVNTGCTHLIQQSFSFGNSSSRLHNICNLGVQLYLAIGVSQEGGQQKSPWRGTSHCLLHILYTDRYRFSL